MTPEQRARVEELMEELRQLRGEVLDVEQESLEIEGRPLKVGVSLGGPL